MHIWVRGIATAVILSAIMATSSGCALFVVAGAGAAAGVGTAQYIRGELKQAYAAPMDKAWDASLAAVEEMKMKVTEKYIDNMDQNRVIKGETEGKKEFQISLEKMGPDVTMVKVRIGTFGDEAYSRQVQDLIARNLNK